jgi:hypothetical protein
MGKKVSKRRPVTSTPALFDSATIARELEAIRKLLMLLSIKLGATTTELGVALGVSKQRVSQLIAAGEIKKLSLRRSDQEDNG